RFELDLRLHLPRELSHPHGHVAPDRGLRPELSEEVASLSAELKNARARSHHAPDEVRHLPVVKAVLPVPVVPDRRDPLEVFSRALAAHRNPFTADSARPRPSP